MQLKKLKNEKGQTVLEYIIISSLVGIFCLVAVKQFGQTMRSRIEKMKSEIVQTIPM